MTKRCLRCCGTGHVGGGPYQRECRICGGTGYVDAASASIRCGLCKGTGEGERTIWGRQPCPRCGSTGYALPDSHPLTTLA